MLSVADFILAGYKQYPVGRLDSDWAKAMVQKRVADETGVKYFITVYFSEINHHHYGVFKNVAARLQLNSAVGTHNHELLTVDNIESMELHFEFLWTATSSYYYERYGE